MQDKCSYYIYHGKPLRAAVFLHKYRLARLTTGREASSVEHLYIGVGFKKRKRNTIIQDYIKILTDKVRVSVFLVSDNLCLHSIEFRI